MNKVYVDMHITYKTCVNFLFMLLIKLPVNSRLLVFKFWEVKSYMWFPAVQGVGTLKQHVLQGSTVDIYYYLYYYKLYYINI